MKLNTDQNVKHGHQQCEATPPGNVKHNEHFEYFENNTERYTQSPCAPQKLMWVYRHFTGKMGNEHKDTMTMLNHITKSEIHVVVQHVKKYVELQAWAS